MKTNDVCEQKRPRSPSLHSAAWHWPEPEGVCAIRVSHRAERKRGQGHISPRYLLRCGRCNRAVQIYYGPDDLEINGVYGSIENWREILLPLLHLKGRGKYFVADTIRRRIPKPSPGTRRFVMVELDDYDTPAIVKTSTSGFIFSNHL